MFKPCGDFIFHNYYYLVQLHEIKIILGAIGAFVVELEHAHVLFLDFNSTIVEWVCGMLASSNCDDHIWSQHCAIGPFGTLWRYTKDSAHRFLAISFDCKYTVFY